MKPIEYMKETKTELSHVSWPTRKQAIAFTAIVVGVSIAVSIYLGLADFIFSRIIRFIIG